MSSRLRLLINLDFSFSPCQFFISCLFTFDFFLVFLRLTFCLVTFEFIVLSRVCLYCLVDFVNCCDLFFSRQFRVNCRDLFFFCVELDIKRFSLVALIYKPSFNPIIRSYIVYELTIHHNQSYFNNYWLDRILPTKKLKNKRPWFISGPYRPTFQYSKIISLDILTDTT